MCIQLYAYVYMCITGVYSYVYMCITRVYRYAYIRITCVYTYVYMRITRVYSYVYMCITRVYSCVDHELVFDYGALCACVIFHLIPNTYKYIHVYKCVDIYMHAFTYLGAPRTGS